MREYKKFNRNVTEDEMNELGGKGWVLVSHVAVPATATTKFSQEYIFAKEASCECKIPTREKTRPERKASIQRVWGAYAKAMGVK